MHYKETTKPISFLEQPLVSIITPLYNAEKFIVETIKSVLDQTYSNWEQLIIDDFSTDGSVVVAKKYFGNDSRIKLVELDKNRGAAYCRNHATKLSKGTYITFLDADDLWHPEKLEKQIGFMEKNKHMVSYTSYLHIDEHGNSLNKRILALPKLSYKKQHRNNYVGNLTGAYNADVLGKILAPNIRKRQDWAVWLEAIKRSKEPAVGIQEDLAKYRIRRDSISSDKMDLLKHNFLFYRNHLGHTWIGSGFYLLRFLLEYFLIRTKQIKKL